MRISYIHKAGFGADKKVQRISVAFFCDLGASLKRIRDIDAGSTVLSVWQILSAAERALKFLFEEEWFLPAVKTAYISGQRLSKALEELSKVPELSSQITQQQVNSIIDALNDFEVVLANELLGADTYYVDRVSGFDTETLIWNAEKCFPAEFGNKVPEALPDIREAGKCLAFSLNTAAGFHALRAMEAVVRSYWSRVSGGKPHPEQKNLGAYIKSMDENNFGSKKVLSALKQIKDLHRNPLMHPEETLDSEDAIALWGICQSAISAMLKEISNPRNDISLSSGTSVSH